MTVTRSPWRWPVGAQPDRRGGGTVGSDLMQGSGSFDSSTGAEQVAAKSPALFCQNVECGAPTGGVVYPLCPTCNNRLKNGGPLP